MVQFAMAIHIYLNLRRMGLNRVPEETWRSWIDEPEQRRGPIGELIDSVTSGRPLEAVREEDLGFEALQARERLPFERDLKVLKVSIGAGPLVGLLGTVTGMLSTFGALGSGSGGEKTMALVARGISEALITTETGLVIAIPGLLLGYQLGRKLDAYGAFLAHLETVCTQKLHRKERRQMRELARREALLRVRGTLRRHLSGGRASRKESQPTSPESRAAADPRPCPART
jgi:biopolymer transport protein ExbB